MADINEMLKKSYKTINELQVKLGELNQVHDDIVNLKKEAIKGNNFSSTIPKEFEKKFDEVRTLSQKYLTDINTATNKYFEINNKVFLDNQTIFGSHIKDLQSKNTELQSKINSLKLQLDRLEKVDFEVYFAKLQKTLADIFGTINAMNLTLTNTVQTLTNIVQSIGTIQTLLHYNHKEVKQILSSFCDVIERHLNDQDKQALTNFELLEAKLSLIAEQNVRLKNEIKLNRIFQIVGLVIILIGLIYLVVK